MIRKISSLIAGNTSISAAVKRRAVVDVMFDELSAP
jgi:hypothetical protein